MRARRSACLLIENRHLRGEPLADWETLKAMTPDQICSLFAWHHVTYHEWCGHKHPTEQRAALRAKYGRPRPQ